MRKLFGLKKKDDRSSRHSMSGPPPSSFIPQTNPYAQGSQPYPPTTQPFDPGSQQYPQAFHNQQQQQYASNRHSYTPSPQPQHNQTPPPANTVRPGEPFRSQGDDLTQQGDYTGAVVMYDAALRAAPNDVGLLLSRTTALSMTNPPRLDQALKDADMVIQLDPRSWQGWLEKGRVLSRMGDLQSAEEALTNAVGFAQDYGRNVAQSHLADVRARRAQFSATTTSTSSSALTSAHHTSPPSQSSFPTSTHPTPPQINVTGSAGTTSSIPLRPAQASYGPSNTIPPQTSQAPPVITAPAPLTSQTTPHTTTTNTTGSTQTGQQSQTAGLQPSSNTNFTWAPSSPGRATTPRPNGKYKLFTYWNSSNCFDQQLRVSRLAILQISQRDLTVSVARQTLRASPKVSMIY